MTRFTRLSVVLVFALALLGGFASPAQQVSGGGLIDINNAEISAPQIADLINQYFEDGSKGDGSVDSNIILILTQCYAGSWRRVFNGPIAEEPAGGSTFDVVSFTDTVRMTLEQTPRAVSYFEPVDPAANFVPGAAAALLPGMVVDATDVFDAGVAAQSSRLTALNHPLLEGPSARLIGGLASTHILYWASNPEAHDFVAIASLASNWPETPPTQTVTVLAGDGTGGMGVDGAATIANLDAALTTIGAMMSPTEQFIFIVGDHGSNARYGPPITVPPMAMQTVLWSYDGSNSSGLLESQLRADPIFSSTEYWVLPPVPFNPSAVAVEGQVDNGLKVFLGTLDTWTQTTRTTPLGTTYEVFELPTTPEGTNFILSQLTAGIPFTIRHDIFNADTTPVPIDFAMSKVSNVPQIPDTSPGVPVLPWPAGVLCAVLLGWVGARVVRRARTGEPGTRTR